MAIIGIDPGKAGAVAVINADGSTADVRDFPVDKQGIIPLELFSMIAEMRSTRSEPVTHILVENVHAMPGQGVTSMFSFGKSFGIILGVTGVLGIAVEMVPPQKWQKLFGIGKDTKGDAVSKAARLFPDAELYGPRGGAKDGRADALLVAEYGRRILIGGGAS